MHHVSMALETAAARPAEELTSDQRWAAWVAKGREHDRTARKRGRALLVVIAIAAALWLLLALLQ